MGAIFFLLVLYIVIFLAVKHGINYSYIGQLAKNKFPNEVEEKNISDEEIEQELHKEEKR